VIANSLLEIAFITEEESDSRVLRPLASEFESRGFKATWTNDLWYQAPVGIFAVHTNHFWNFETGVLRRPRCDFSAILLHDLGQDNGNGGYDYFSVDPWHFFDLGFVPGPSWIAKVLEAKSRGIALPRLGVIEGGWPPLLERPPELSSRAHDRRRLLLATSWTRREHLDGTLRALGARPYDVTVKLADPNVNIADDSPWVDVLMEAQAEKRWIREHPPQDRRLTIAPIGASIGDLLAAADIVISNGSSIAYEGLLWGRPAVCVTDWGHPSGPSGLELVDPPCGGAGMIPTRLDCLA